MGQARRQYDAQMKLAAVLELLKGQKTAAQICREKGISDDLLSRWKDAFLERAAGVFDDPKNRRTEEEERIAELEKLIGQQALELSILKKASSATSFRSIRGGK
jgi:transposase-like protein